MENRIDLNCDIGEGFGAYTLGHDEEIIPFITSANIACGFHAGDPQTMRKTVSLAEKAGVAIGAHPGFPDLPGFGRREMQIPMEEVRDYITYQMGALQAFTRQKKLQHVKTHGALYNMAAKDEKLAIAIAEAVYEFDPDLILVGLSGSAWLEAGRKVGVRVASEIFADRAFNRDGSLVARSLPGAVIHNPAEVVKRAVKMVVAHKVTAITGEEIPVRGDTICLHGDTPGAGALAQMLKKELVAAGVVVVSLGSFLKKP